MLTTIYSRWHRHPSYGSADGHASRRRALGPQCFQGGLSAACRRLVFRRETRHPTRVARLQRPTLLTAGTWEQRAPRQRQRARRAPSWRSGSIGSRRQR